MGTRTSDISSWFASKSDKGEEMMALRTCTKCGLEAHTEEDLSLFKLAKKSKYNRENLCMKCYNDIQRPYGKRQKRWQSLVEHFPKPVLCTHCGSVVDDLESTREPMSLAIHSVDGNHENWNPLNKTPMHLRCHSSFHNAGENNPRYKGSRGKAK